MIMYAKSVLWFPRNKNNNFGKHKIHNLHACTTEVKYLFYYLLPGQYKELTQQLKKFFKNEFLDRIVTFLLGYG